MIGGYLYAHDETTTRQRIFELFEEAARLADSIDDRPLATLALAGTMIAAQPSPTQRTRRPKPRARIKRFTARAAALTPRPLAALSFKGRRKMEPR